LHSKSTSETDCPDTQKVGHPRVVHVEQHPRQKAETCTRVLERALAELADLGLSPPGAVMTDDAFAYTKSRRFPAALARGRRPPHPHPGVHTTPEWQGRALHPNASGPTPHLAKLQRTRSRPAKLRPLLQQAKTAHLARRPTPNNGNAAIRAQRAARSLNDGWRARGYPHRSQMMMHIATVHWRSDRWIDVQLRYLKRHLDVPHQIYAFLNDVPGDHADKFFYSSAEPIKSHATKLNLLADVIRFNSCLVKDADLVRAMLAQSIPTNTTLSLDRRHLPWRRGPSRVFIRWPSTRLTPNAGRGPSARSERRDSQRLSESKRLRRFRTGTKIIAAP
jgi:hypothetical protein